MRDYLVNSKFYLDTFPVDPNFDKVRLLKLIIEDNHAHITVGLINILPQTPPKSWNTRSLDSTKIIISFEFVEFANIKNIIQGGVGCLRLIENDDSSISAVYLCESGRVELKCKFISVGGILPYSESNSFEIEK